MRPEVLYGHCQCGCDERVSISRATDASKGYRKGEPVRYVADHQARGPCNPRWKGGTRIRPDGYVLIWTPGHYRANQNYVMEHILILEKAFGKPLPTGAMCHHVDGKRSNNTNTNLVLCQDDSYHKLLHMRTKALKACGHASWRKCMFCSQWDETSKLFINSQGRPYHVPCERANQKKRRRQGKNHANPRIRQQ